MIWILAAIIIILLLILFLELDYHLISALLGSIFVAIAVSGVLTCLEATDVDWLDSMDGITWNTSSKQVDSVVSVKMPSDSHQEVYICR